MTATTALKQIYPNDPHVTVSAINDLVIVSATDLDLESSLQFVRDGSSVQFDFSAYVLVQEGNLEEEKKRISDEIHAFDNLLKAVQEAHAHFTTNALAALHTLDS